MTCSLLPSTGGGTQMPSAILGSVSDRQVGWMLSKSVPFLRICLNCSSVRPPSGRPFLSGVRLREIMTGPAYGNPVVGSIGYPAGGYEDGTEPGGNPPTEALEGTA